MRRNGADGGLTALHLAATHLNTSNKIAKVLLEHGADINARTDK